MKASSSLQGALRGDKSIQLGRVSVSDSSESEIACAGGLRLRSGGGERLP